MNVENMTSNKGNKIANQFIVNIDDDFNTVYFQSYESVIAKKQWIEKKELVHHEDENHPTMETRTEKKVYLDKTFWDYSVTTGKYRNIFLDETKKETQKKIDNGTYILTDLNNRG
tara:strand:- start:617 stop:961 length:345 start_codon:yes stop_codon:yes gene_type:complete